MSKILVFLLSILLVFAAHAGEAPGPAFDQYVVQDPFGTQPTIVGGQTSGTIRTQTINPAQKTLVLIVGPAQSNWNDVAPTTYIPTNVGAIDNFNLYDSASRQIVSGLVGSVAVSPYGLGNIAVRVADNFVTNGVFNRVIIVDAAVGTTTMDKWANGTLASRVPTALARLASRGITQSTPGVTFALLMGLGETDTSLGTSQASYTTSLTTFITNIRAIGYTNRIFICQETWSGGITSAGIRAAQLAAVNNIDVFTAGDLDTFNATYRQPSDNLHFIDNGLLAVGNLVYNTMHASGSPFYWQPPYATNDNNPWAALEGCNDNTSDLCRAM